jgi:hypothetical protein
MPVAVTAYPNGTYITYGNYSFPANASVSPPYFPSNYTYANYTYGNGSASTPGSGPIATPMPSPYYNYTVPMPAPYYNYTMPSVGTGGGSSYPYGLPIDITPYLKVGLNYSQSDI